MKILHVETGKKLYGGAFQVVQIIKGLNSRGVENILVCDQQSEISKACQGFCQVETLSISGDLDFAFAFRLKRIIDQEKPDLVHLHSRRGADTFGAIASRWSKTPTVLSRRVDNPEARWVMRLKYALYDHVITISQAIRTVLIAGGVEPDKISCVHSTVDYQRYAQPGDASCLPEQISPEKPIIAMLAQFIKRKGHHQLLDAIPAILEKHPDTQFLLCGKGALEAEIAQRVETMGLQNWVFLPGFIHSIEKILPCFYALVHPAQMEGLGVSLLQASAAGVPIVGADRGGIPEVVRDKVNGFLIDPDQPEQISDAVIRLLDRPNLRKQMGINGQALVKKHFSVETMIAGNLDVYQRLLATK